MLFLSQFRKNLKKLKDKHDQSHSFKLHLKIQDLMKIIHFDDERFYCFSNNFHNFLN